MAITGEHVGRSYTQGRPYRVSRAKIEEFAAAVGDQSPQTQQDPAIAPPTFAMVIAAQAWEALFADAELDLALRRMVHGDQRFSYTRPLREGDEVVSTLTIDKVRNRGASDIITITVTLSVEGDQVCQATSTLFHTREELAA